MSSESRGKVEYLAADTGLPDDPATSNHYAPSSNQVLHAAPTFPTLNAKLRQLLKFFYELAKSC